MLKFKDFWETCNNLTIHLIYYAKLLLSNINKMVEWENWGTTCNNA